MKQTIEVGAVKTIKSRSAAVKVLLGTVIAVGLVSRSCFAVAAAGSGLEKTTVPYRKVDGLEILADVYRPKGSSSVPVIVYIHGGALIMGNRQLTPDYHVQARVLSLAEQSGYALVSIDYRLAPEAKLPAIISDIEAAFTWLGGEGTKRFHLNTDRMVVVGDSAGGYLTLITGYRVRPRPKALVALYGYGDLSADWYGKPNPYPDYNREKITEGQADQQTDGTVVSDSTRRKGDGGKIYMYYRQNGLWLKEVSGFSAATLAKDIEPYTPLKNVTRAYPPTLFIHGTWDMDVPYEESLKMSDQLRRRGVPYILSPIGKGGHGFGGGDPQEIDDAFSTMQDFMTRYLEGRQ